MPYSGSGEGAGGYDLKAHFVESSKEIDFSKFKK